MRLPPVSPSLLRWSLLLATSVTVWLFATGLWNPTAWQTPAAYGIDALEVLARFKLSGEKGLSFFFDKTMTGLGAPWGADWSAYPMPDAPLFVVFGKIGSVIGLIPASNLALLFAHISAVATFYYCSRALGHRATFAAGAALLFGFSFYFLHRSLSHFSFTLAYIVPAQLLSVWLIGSAHRLLLRRKWQVFCLATAVATGMANPYFGFVYGQLLVLALVYQAVTTGRRQNLLLGGACLAVFGVTLVFLNYSSLLVLLGGGPGLNRSYAGTEVYGLRPIEWFIPPPSHHWGVAARMAERYASVTTFRGELFSPYFGLAGLGGLACIVGAAVRRWQQRRPGLRPAYAATFLWIMLFFMIGGLNSLLAFAGLDLFRAGNRYSIYLLAIALLALTSWASRRGRLCPTWLALAFTVPAVLIGLWDQLPRPRPAPVVSALLEKLAADRQVAAALADQLPANAAVFQLPVVPFLEQPPFHHMADYELFRPWLFSEHIRFSYGLLAGDPALRWDRRTASLPAGAMCAALESAGYAALYLHKQAFPDGAARLRAQLTKLGRKQLVEADDHVVFALQPASQPSLPDLTDARLADPWNETAGPEDQIQLYASKGWFALERDNRASWRWAGSTATLMLWSPDKDPLPVVLNFKALALRPGLLVATFNNKTIWRANAGPVPIPETVLSLMLQPGANHVTFRFNGRVARPSGADSRQLGFQLANLRVNPDH